MCFNWKCMNHTIQPYWIQEQENLDSDKTLNLLTFVTLNVCIFFMV